MQIPKAIAAIDVTLVGSMRSQNSPPVRDCEAEALLACPFGCEPRLAQLPGSAANCLSHPAEGHHWRQNVILATAHYEDP
jgi:hypothetical protein